MTLISSQSDPSNRDDPTWRWILPNLVNSCQDRLHVLLLIVRTPFPFVMRYAVLPLLREPSNSLITLIVLFARLGINASMRPPQERTHKIALCWLPQRKFSRFDSLRKGRSVNQNSSLLITRRSVPDVVFESTASNISPMSSSSSWTDHKVDLEAACFRDERYNLGPGKMILYNNALSTYFLECDEKYFLWNDVSDGIDQIMEPAGLEDIIAALPHASNYKVPDYSKMQLVALEVE